MQTLLIIAGGIGVFGTAAAFAIKGFRWLLRLLNQLQEFLDDWKGQAARPGYPRRPGVIERLFSVETRLAAVEAQLLPSDGRRTLADSVERIETAVTGEDHG